MQRLIREMRYSTSSYCGCEDANALGTRLMTPIAVVVHRRTDLTLRSSVEREKLVRLN